MRATTAIPYAAMMEARTFPLNGLYRSVLAFAVLLGVVAIGSGAAGLVGPSLGLTFAEEAPPHELGLAILLGFLMIPFGLTALRQPGLRIEARQLSWIRLGPICGMAELPYSQIERMGVGTERSRNGKFHVLLLEGTDGRTSRIKLSMYREWREAVALLTERTGLAQSPTRDSWRGLQFRSLD